jgi:asparagine synthase (glutamine-hydrolysing)
VLSEVRKLPGGHLLSIDEGGLDIRAWYQPRFSHSAAGRPRRAQGELVEEFGALLAQAARRCLVSDVPVALLLSEGIDSNGIRFALADSGTEVPSFTYRLSDSASRLMPITGVVRDSGNGIGPAFELRVTPRARLEQLDEVFSGFTEPLGDGASLATWLLIRNARSHATVFLCGHGADEILGGYRLSQDRYRLAAMRYLAWLPTWSLRLLIDNKTFGDEPPAARQRMLRFTARRRVPAVARYLIHRPLPLEDLAMLFRQALPERYLATVDRLYADCDDAATDLDRIQEVMLHTFLPEDILSFADSVAMDSSAELRLPYLDRDLVDFALTLPPVLRVSPWPGRANTKQILREWGKTHLPREIVERRKQNFNYGSLRQLLVEDGPAVRERILAAPLRRALPGLEGWVQNPPEYFRGPWEGTLWALLSLGIWADAAGLR